MTPEPTHTPNTFASKALVIAVLAGVVIAACVAAGAADMHGLLRAYLTAWLFWLEFSIGCFAMLLLHNLTGGKWGFAVRPFARAGAATLPLMAVLFLPIALGIEQLYEWADAEAVSHDRILQHKQPYLNATFFTIRAAAYFVIWIGFWLLTQAMARKLFASRDERDGQRLRLASGWGLFTLGLTITFASVDWAMSLEPHWFSAIYGVMFFIGQCLAGLALVIGCSIWLPHRGWRLPLPTTAQMHDLGKLLFAFVMLWAYMSFMQFLIIWYGNLPEEVTWYLKRTTHGWGWIAAGLVLLHFFAPFFLLLSRRLKRNPQSLMKIAALVVVMRWVDVWWLIEPAFEKTDLYLPWLDLLATLVVGGLWLANYAWSVPQEDEFPRRGVPRETATS